MISTELRLVIILVVLLFITLIITAIRKRKLNISFSLFWLVTGVLLLIAVLIPNFIEMVSTTLGFEKASNMIFFISIFILLILVFNITIIISKLHKNIINLTQEVSSLKHIIKEKEVEK